MEKNRKINSSLSGKDVAASEVIYIKNLRPPLVNLLKKVKPDINEEGAISDKEYNKILSEYIEDLLENDRGDLSKIENEVVKSFEEAAVISKNVNISFDEKITFGQKISDKIAEFGGSWTFIISFLLFLFLWMGVNIFSLFTKPFDPYPFILLNLILSALAAIQAPIIMMSQNRVEAKDRLQAEHDYQVNLKAELEIRSLHEKMDHLLLKQMQHLSEIQQIQIDLLNQIRENKR